MTEGADNFTPEERERILKMLESYEKSPEERERILKMLEGYEKRAVVWAFMATIFKWASGAMLFLVALKTFFGDLLLKRGGVP